MPARPAGPRMRGRQRLRATARRELRGVLGLGAGTALGQVLGLAAAGLLGVAVVDAARGRGWAQPLLLAAALIVVQAVLGIAVAALGERVAARVAAAQRRAVLDHVLAVGPEIRRSAAHGAGLVKVSMGQAPLATARYASTYLPQVLAALLGTVAAGVVLVLRAPLVALLVMVCLAAVPVTQQAWRRSLGRRGEEYWSATAAFADRLDDTLRGIDDIVRTGAAERVVDRLALVADDVRRTAVAALRSAMAVHALTTLLLGGAGVGAMVLLTWQAHGGLSAAAALGAWAVLPEAGRPLHALREAWFAGHSALVAQGQIDRVLDVPVPLRSVGPVAGGGSPRRTAPELALVGVCVVAESDGASVEVLKDVTATFPAGRTTALLGESGAGKSTLLSLLMRHRDPTSGRVLLDGTDLREIPLPEVRRMFAWVSQDVVLFDGTVADNLRLARPGARHAEIESAARRARLLVPVEDGGVAEGLGTPVGDNGRLLSGGQRQRVALARALLRDSPVLVLDEPTAALDDHNQSAVVAALAEAARERTVIVVSHRRDGLPPLAGTVRLEAGAVVASDPAPCLMGVR